MRRAMRYATMLCNIAHIILASRNASHYNHRRDDDSSRPLYGHHWVMLCELDVSVNNNVRCVARN